MQNADRSHQQGYVASLDGLRACAAIVVLFFHARMPFSGGGGVIGVGAFFVLSGFLITKLIADEYSRTGTLDYTGFQSRRIARLAPCVLAFLLTFVIVAPLLFPKALVWQEVLPTLFYYSDFSFIATRQPDLMQHTWSLSVEMQFYLLWPLLIVAVMKFCKGREAQTLLGVFLLFVAWRFALRYGFDSGFHRSYYSLDNAAASLAIGGWLAFRKIELKPERANSFAMLGFAVYVVLLVQGWRTVQENNALFLTINDVASVMVILALLQPASLASRILSNRIPVTLGLWSYGIYVWHYPIARLLRSNESADAQRAVLILVVTVALAAITYYLVEMPGRRALVHAFNRLRSKLQNANTSS